LRGERRDTAAIKGAEHAGADAGEHQESNPWAFGVARDIRHTGILTKQARAPEDSGHPRRSGKRTRSPTAV